MKWKKGREALQGGGKKPFGKGPKARNASACISPSVDPKSLVSCILNAHFPLSPLRRAPQPRRQRQIPRERRSAVQILWIKSGGREPLPRGLGIDQGQIAVQNAPPAALGLIGAAAVEKGLPLLGDEGAAARVRCRRQVGQHVDAVDELGFGAEVGRVVDFVLEQDAGHLVRDEAAGLVDVARFEQEVAPQGAPEHGQHQVPTRFHGAVAAGVAPQFDRVGQVRVFGGGFFVFAVGAVEEAFGPRVPVVPVEGAGHGEVRVARGRVGAVADEGVDPVFVGLVPRSVEISDDGRRVDEVGPVETVWGQMSAERVVIEGEMRGGLLMVVVVRIPKIRIGIASHEGGCRDNTTPCRLVGQRELLRIRREALKSNL